MSSAQPRAAVGIPVVPASPVITSAPVNCTSARSLVISGTKQAGARILLNGRPVGGKRGTTWSTRVALRAIGTYTLNFYAQTSPDPLGLSKPAVVQVTHARPGGCVTIGIVNVEALSRGFNSVAPNTTPGPGATLLDNGTPALDVSAVPGSRAGFIALAIDPATNAIQVGRFDDLSNPNRLSDFVAFVAQQPVNTVLAIAVSGDAGLNDPNAAPVSVNGQLRQPFFNNPQVSQVRRLLQNLGSTQSELIDLNGSFALISQVVRAGGGGVLPVGQLLSEGANNLSAVDVRATAQQQ